MSQGDIISSLDLLDIDEDVVDNRLKSLMTKNSLTNEHLNNVLHLLQYKILINTREESECENNDEFDFIVKLLNNLNDENVDHISKIVNIALCLNPSSLLSKAEHLIQQILINIETELINKQEYSMLLQLKICSSIMDAVLKFDSKLSLVFVETPLEGILDSSNEKLKKYFLTVFVPKLFKSVNGYNILNRIWDYVKKLEGEKINDGLKIMSCLADYYIPSEKMEIISDVIFQNEFWSTVEYGISSNDASIRKIGVYLAKRAIDSVAANKKDINLDNIFTWKNKDSVTLKSKWNNFFILLESLEEKQGNIVLPSLKLFEMVDIGEKWMYCAFKLGLNHDNFQVRLKCMEHRLNYRIKSQGEALMLLEAFNDINIYDQIINVEVIRLKLSELFNDDVTFLEIFKTMSLVKWSPVPLYNLTSLLANSNVTQINLIEAAINILKIPCNNIILRKEIHTNIGKIVNKSGKLKWQDLMRIYFVISFENLSELKFHHPFMLLIKEMNLGSEEKVVFFVQVIKNSRNLDIITLYLTNHVEDENIFIDIINKKIDAFEKIEIITSDLSEDLHFVMSMILLYNNTELSENIRESISKRSYIIMEYIYNLFILGVNMNIEDIVALLKIKNFDHEKCATATRMAVYRQCLTAHFTSQPTDTTDYDAMQNSLCTIHLVGAEFTIIRKILYMFLLRLLLVKPENCLQRRSSSLELLNDFLSLYFEYKSKENKIECVGRLKNIDKEISCEVLYLLTSSVALDELERCTDQIIDFVENALERGGYGCLEWILKISNLIMVYLIKEPSFKLPPFLNKLWQEIEELKSNNQYNVCIKSFVKVITNDALLGHGDYNNVLSLYISRIIEMSAVKLHPLYYLLKEFESKGIDKYGYLVYGFCDMLLFNPVRRKDERISDNLAIDLLQDENSLIQNDGLDILFPFKLQYLSLSIICKTNSETARIIRKLISNKIDELFRNKQRYHGNSQLHRTLQIALQHLMMLTLIDRSDLEKVFNWSLDMFVKLPHQNSVRICFEWFIALYFYIKKTTINEEMLQILKSKNIPITSQFFIVFWLLKHKIQNDSNTVTEFEFVMDFLLSNTMGQLFNVRLNAQYLSTMLYNLPRNQKSTKYEYTIGLIEKTFTESSLDKTFVKLQSNYFIHGFDIISNLTPYFLYYVLPKYCGVTSNEKVMVDFVKNTTNAITQNLNTLNEDEFISEWKVAKKSNEEFEELSIDEVVATEIDGNVELNGVIQKKYIPWKNMSDVNVYDVMKKRQSSSELIVVASLIDKLPNLGGMARTSEVFGVKTYVVDSLRHLQDRQFQNLSVSAERWIDVKEVRPNLLKEYLMKKKSEGYSVVAAEQTSSSCPLQTFKFPKKTLLLLGHEKEGVPCDLLPIMDHCVEIPQQGYVRSLNVHVTAAIFVWEYARQNVL